MNREGRTPSDFGDVCHRILEDYTRLVALQHHPVLAYETFEFSKFTTDPKYLMRLVDWTGIHDVEVSSSILTKKINKNDHEWFPSWPDWEEVDKLTYQKVENALVPEEYRWSQR